MRGDGVCGGMWKVLGTLDLTSSNCLIVSNSVPDDRGVNVGSSETLITLS